MNKLFKKSYGGKERVEWVRNQRCYVTGRPGSPGNPVVNSHIKTRGAGGGATDVVPMLLSLEIEFHANGRDTFEQDHDVSLRFLADLCEDRWQIYKAKTDERDAS